MLPQGQDSGWGAPCTATRSPWGTHRCLVLKQQGSGAAPPLPGEVGQQAHLGSLPRTQALTHVGNVTESSGCPARPPAFK